MTDGGRVDGREDLIDLRDYLTVLWNQRRTIAAVTLLVVLGAALAQALRTPTYEASTELELQRVRTAEEISLRELLSPSGIVTEDDLAAASSTVVVDRAAATLGRDDTAAIRASVSVTIVEGTQRLRFTATADDAAEAAALADALGAAFVETRRDDAVAAVGAAQQELAQRAEELRADIAVVDAQLAELQPDAPATIDTNGDGVADAVVLGDETTPSPELQSLQLERGALESQLARTIQRTTELDISTESLLGLDAAVTPATVPTRPVGGGFGRTLVLALVLGLMLGVGLAFLRDHFDDVVRTEADLKRTTGNLPVLGRIPVWEPATGDPDRQLASLVEPSSHPSEAYRELSAGVRFLLVARNDEVAAGPASDHGLGHSRSILLSSADIGEGKTATAGNLAVATARAGIMTILVDADLRRSAVGRRFGLPKMPGLSDALLEGAGPADYLVDVGVPKLRILPGGTTPPNPTELLASPAMRAMHRQLLDATQLVIYDTPAALAVADTLEIGPLVDMGIIVARVGTTTRRRLESALERLGRVGVDISGSVVNGLQTQHEGYYYQSYDNEEDVGEVEPDAAGDDGHAPGRPGFLQRDRR